MAIARSVLPAIGDLVSSSKISSIGSLKLWKLQRSLSSFRRCHSLKQEIAHSRMLSGLFVRCSSSSCASSGKQTEISALVMVEETLDTSPELENVVKQLEKDAARAVKLAVRGHEAAELADVTELSLTVCGDKYIRKLNKEWLGKDRPTDVLSFPQNQPPGESPLLLLGDVVISVETAAEQAKERNHSLLDEMRILLVHGLLHLLGHDHELGTEESDKMQKVEQTMLSTLGWKGKGLISASHSAASDDDSTTSAFAGVSRKSKSPYKLLFCDMDGTLLNSKSRITKKTANALKAAIDAGVQVIIATGKTRYATISALQQVGLAGERGAVSSSTPGVFLQGLLVYGQGGTLVHRQLLSQEYCFEALTYALEHKVPAVGFCGDTTVAPFNDPLLRCLHEQYFEPKAEVLKSLDDLASRKIQKLLFQAEQERIDRVIKPQLQAMTGGNVTMVQAQRDMLEIIPQGASKGGGVQKLLDHLGVDADEVMAIGDGENDVEMLEMAGWGVAMANAAPRTLEAADVTVASNDHDGVAEAVERFLLP